MQKKGFTTTILHADLELNPEHGALHQAVHHSVAYGYPDATDLAGIFQGTVQGYAYSRQSNPTLNALEKKITKMENGLSSLVFATGMSAIATPFSSLLRAGDHIISSSFLFGNTSSLLYTLIDLGIEISFVDATDVQNVADALQENTRMVFVETIANPVTQVSHLDAIGVFCQTHNLLYVVDNTMTSPYLFQPETVHASLIINSLTKYISGHGNVLGGSITDTGLYDWTQYPNINDSYKKFAPNIWGITQIKKKGLRDMGASLSSDSAHRIAIGAETLALRMQRCCHNAQKLAAFFSQHPKINKVYYPGNPDHPQHTRAKTLFRHFGAIMCIVLQDDIDCFAFLNALELVIASTNLGDTRTLAIPVAHTIYYEMGAQRRKEMGIPDTMIRLSIGIEDIDDLLHDFQQALE